LDVIPIPLSAITVFLQLGSKYAIDQMRDEAIQRLSYEFPSRLQDFDELGDQLLLIEELPGLYYDVIKLARNHNIPSILPLALYFCVACEDFQPELILRGILREDGTLATLSSDDQQACLTGYYNLIRAQAAETFTWLEPNQNAALFRQCYTPKTCARTRAKLLQGLWHPWPRCIALGSWDDEWGNDMCKICTSQAITHHNIGRKKIWEKLPSLFGLPIWDELTKHQ
jgi:hypothetical protein